MTKHLYIQISIGSLIASVIACYYYPYFNSIGLSLIHSVLSIWFFGFILLNTLISITLILADSKLLKLHKLFWLYLLIIFSYLSTDLFNEWSIVSTLKYAQLSYYDIILRTVVLLVVLLIGRFSLVYMFPEKDLYQLSLKFHNRVSIIAVIMFLILAFRALTFVV